MGELIVGRPALQVNAAVSVPLDMVSVMSLLYRAVPGSGLDPWLVATRRNMPAHLQHDLDLLHGFSGRLLYYMEEPIMRFEPLRDDRRNATIDELVEFLESEPAIAFREMLERALARVHKDIGSGLVIPSNDDEVQWRRYIEPGITTAAGDEVIQLAFDPEELKTHTIGLIRGVWDFAYKEEYSRHLVQIKESGRIAEESCSKGLAAAFAELTGNRVPSTLAAGLGQAARVTFVPSMHLGSFMSFILYPHDVIIFFSAENVLKVGVEANAASVSLAANGAKPNDSVDALEGAELLESLRALGDPNRMRILDLLGTGELYANEIVGRLGIAQSAVSRHLSQLERSGLVVVNPRGGMKYYGINCARLAAVGETLRNRAAKAVPPGGTMIAT